MSSVHYELCMTTIGFHLCVCRLYIVMFSIKPYIFNSAEVVQVVSKVHNKRKMKFCFNFFKLGDGCRCCRSCVERHFAASSVDFRNFQFHLLNL